MRTYVLVLYLISQAWADCEYSSCPKLSNKKLNVHLVAHTHDDVGWLKTVDQYYYGANDTIKWANAGVQYILDTVIPHLVMDPSKRFIFVETAYFWRWWEEQEGKMQDTVKDLVKRGQLEFILGGWCMNDEATVHYTAMIQQLSLGVNYLTDIFGKCGYPKVGWQIDPFGHSKAQAEIFALAGFDGLFFGRADYQDKEARQRDNRMEMLWQSVKSGTFNKGSLFTGVNEHGYNPPDGFCFDPVCAGDDPIMDDKRLNGYNVDDVIKRFKAAAESQKTHFTGNNIMMTMGSDFQYRNAYMWFKNLDKLIKYVNKADVGLNLFYSTPSCYLKSKHDESDGALEEKVDDFFPYADGAHKFWTGYFTSRAGLKGYVRETNSVLNVCKQMNYLIDGTEQDNVDILSRAFAVAQHHDAVSGTERQPVANDYAERLYKGRSACNSVISKTLMKRHELLDVVHCDYLNISVCQPTFEQNKFDVVILNPSYNKYDRPISIPVNWKPGNVADILVNGIQVAYQVQKVSALSQKLQQGLFYGLGHELTFNARLSGMHTTIAKIKITEKHSADFDTGSRFNTGSRSKSDLNRRIRGFGSLKYSKPTRINFRTEKRKRRANSKTLHIGKHAVVLTRTPAGSGIYSINGVRIKNNCHLFYYKSSTDREQSSGAYIFRPESDEPIAIGVPKLGFVNGEISFDIVLTYSNWAEEVFRFSKTSNIIEHLFTIGELPHAGMEVIFRLETDINSGDEFYTDINGRGEIKRTRDHRDTWNLNQTEPVAGNYYPVNTKIRIQDSDTGAEAAVFPDRAQGGSSIKSGQIELMLLRQTINDDGRGVDEPLNDPGQFGKGLIVKGKHLLHFIPPTNSKGLNVNARKQQQLYEKYMFDLPWIGFTTNAPSSLPVLINACSDNKNPCLVTITSMETVKRADGNVLVRLEHLCTPGIDCTGFDMAEDFDFRRLFGRKVNKVTEYNLIGNYPIDFRNRLVWNGNGPEENIKTVITKDFTVTIEPTDLKTFIIDVE